MEITTQITVENMATDMADSGASASEIESDTDSTKMSIPIPRREELFNRIASLEQENKVLKIELETYKIKCKSLVAENRDLRKASVNIQAQAEQEEEFISNTLLKKIHALSSLKKEKLADDWGYMLNICKVLRDQAQAEQEEEFISNTLLKKIQSLKKEKEKLAVNYEQEEEYLTNDLSRKLTQLRHEKLQLEQTLEQEQEYQVNKLMRKIERLENDTGGKQRKLEELKREKIDLENALEQEQEALVNRLWKRMDKLEAEKRNLQEKLDEPVSAPPSPREIKNGETTETLSRYVEQLRNEVRKLKNQLLSTQMEHHERIVHIQQDEREVREENVRLQRKLLLEQERREALSRHLSESESSLEMDDERQFNEMAQGLRPRTISSPIPYTPNPARPISPAYPALTPPSPATRGTSFASSTVSHPSPISPFGTSPPVGPTPLNPHMRIRPQGPSPSGHHDRFVKPTNPTYTSTPTSNS